MNSSQVEDFFKVFAEEKMTNFCIAEVKEGQALTSIFGVHADVCEMLTSAICHNEEVEQVVVTSLLAFLMKRSSNKEKTVLDFLNVLKESE